MVPHRIPPARVEITALKALPERKPAMRMVPTGRTITQEWDAADDARRREILAEFEVRVVLHPRAPARGDYLPVPLPSSWCLHPRAVAVTFRLAKRPHDLPGLDTAGGRELLPQGRHNRQVGVTPLWVFT
jgi:hypothetical protein